MTVGRGGTYENYCVTALYEGLLRAALLEKLLERNKD